MTTYLFRMTVTSLVSIGLLTSGAGAASAADEDGPVVNFANPTAYTVGTTLSSSSRTASVPATVTWTQFDESGFCGRSALLVTNVKKRPRISPSAVKYLFPWRANDGMGLEMTSTDCAGNESTASKYDYQQLVQQGAFTFGAGWQTQSCECWSGGGNIASSRAGASATYRFDGDSIGLVSVYGPGRGTMDVYIDGKKAKTLNMNRAATTNRVIAFQRQWGNYGTHEIKVVARTAAKIEIDAVLTN